VPRQDAPEPLPDLLYWQSQRGRTRKRDVQALKERSQKPLA
jgi:hypothetical protein